MGIPVLILGESGSGKSSSMRNLNAEDVLLIQAVKKPLPFRSNKWKPAANGEGSIFVSDDWTKIGKVLENIQKTKKNIVVIDDFQYLMAGEFMRRISEKGYDKFSEMGKNVWTLINKCQEIREDITVYFMWHTETSEQTGKIKAKTIGKMLDEKVTIEGLFSIVMRSMVIDGKHLFSTKSNGQDPVKTPFDMYAEGLIDNDLKEVDLTIRDYYDIH